MDLGLQGKVAVVTGGSRGLGRAAAFSLAQEGASVYLCARGAETLSQTIADMSASGLKAAGTAADVATADGCERVVRGARDAFGGVDILLNNVGGGQGPSAIGASDDDWQQSLELTLFPAVRMSRLCVPLMKERRGGVILMIASIYGRESGGRATYNAVKAAEISLAKSMARELAPENIRVNSVAPGSILFPGGSWERRQQADPVAIQKMIEDDLPFGRFGAPNEVCEVVAFLASPRASLISGASITVDGCLSRSLI
ncbi:MAG TPA: SDR family oxidoreductase [Chloroflexota bacterium]|nr:SDR family oxidoreductase [Chloroflexota bacterium]